MTHMVVWLGTTCSLYIQCVLEQGTADLFLKHFWSSTGTFGLLGPKGVMCCYKAVNGKGLTSRPSEPHCLDLLYMWFCTGFFLLVEEGWPCCACSGMTHAEFLWENTGSFQFQSLLQGSCSQAGHAVDLQFSWISVLLLIRTLYQGLGISGLRCSGLKGPLPTLS